MGGQIELQSQLGKGTIVVDQIFTVGAGVMDDKFAYCSLKTTQSWCDHTRTSRESIRESLAG